MSTTLDEMETWCLGARLNLVKKVMVERMLLARRSSRIEVRSPETVGRQACPLVISLTRGARRSIFVHAGDTSGRHRPKTCFDICAHAAVARETTTQTHELARGVDMLWPCLKQRSQPLQRPRGLDVRQLHVRGGREDEVRGR
jgi:hypothetical protein